MQHLAGDLPELTGCILACDCEVHMVCEGDALAGLVFESGRPRAIAVGAIAHSRRARGSICNQCSRLPAVSTKGKRGTWSFASPIRAAHQEAETAIPKASEAVYSASSLEGNTR